MKRTVIAWNCATLSRCL